MHTRESLTLRFIITVIDVNHTFMVIKPFSRGLYVYRLRNIFLILILSVRRKKRCFPITSQHSSSIPAISFSIPWKFLSIKFRSSSFKKKRKTLETIFKSEWRKENIFQQRKAIKLRRKENKRRRKETKREDVSEKQLLWEEECLLHFKFIMLIGWL